MEYVGDKLYHIFLYNRVLSKERPEYERVFEYIVALNQMHFILKTNETSDP